MCIRESEREKRRVRREDEGTKTNQDISIERSLVSPGIAVRISDARKGKARHGRRASRVPWRDG